MPIAHSCINANTKANVETSLLSYGKVIYWWLFMQLLEEKAQTRVSRYATGRRKYQHTQTHSHICICHQKKLVFKVRRCLPISSLYKIVGYTRARTQMSF